MTAADIAAALGAPHRSGAWCRCRCPVHGSRGASLALRDGERGLIVKCFGGCDWREVLAELHRRGLIGGTARALPEFPPSITPAKAPVNDADGTLRASRIWEQTQEAQGTPMAAHLAGRGIDLPVPASLRWAPSLRRLDGSRESAMVARVEHVERGFVGVHRTWLTRNDAAPHWRRLDRASLGPVGGGAVRLAPAAELMLVGEGIETCLAAMQATGSPAWAALGTSGIIALILPPLPLATTVVILADNDANGAGERAARTAAARWLAEGRRVRIAMPPQLGTDFNDVLLGRTRATITEARHAP